MRNSTMNQLNSNLKSTCHNAIQAINYAGTTLALVAGDVFGTPSNLQRIAYICNAYINLLNQTTGIPVPELSKLNIMCKNFYQVFDFMYLFTIASTWLRPVNKEQLINLPEMVEVVEKAIDQGLLVFGSDITQLSPKEDKKEDGKKEDNRYTKLFKDDNFNKFLGESLDGVFTDAGQFIQAKNITAPREVKDYIKKCLIQIGVDQDVAYKNLNINLDKIDISVYNWNDQDRQDVIKDSVRKELKRAILLRIMARESLIQTFTGFNVYDPADPAKLQEYFAGRYASKKECIHALSCAIKQELKQFSLENLNLNYLNFDLTSIELNAPSILEKLSWVGYTVATLVNAYGQGQEWNLFKFDLSAISSRFGKTSVTLGTVISGALFSANFFKLLESEYRSINIRDADEKMRQIWNKYTAIVCMCFYGACLTSLSSVTIYKLVIAAKLFELGSDVTKSRLAPATAF